MFSTVEIIGHLSQALFTIASGFKKVLYLWLALIAASLLEIIYYFIVAARPIWSPILWSGAIIFLNTYQVLRLRFSDDEAELYDLTGKQMDRLHFKK